MLEEYTKSVFTSLKRFRGRAILLTVFLLVVLFVNSSAVPAQEGGEETQESTAEQIVAEEAKKPKKPKKEPPPMKHQPPVDADTLEDFAPTNAKNKKLKKNKEDKKGSVEMASVEDTFITSDDLVFLVESGTFTETLTLEFEQKTKKTVPTTEEEKIKNDKIHFLHEFQVEIINPANGKIHHNFGQRVRVGLDVREFGIDLEEMGGTFFLAYRNPLNPNELIDVPVTTYDEKGLIAAEVTHFSDWTAGWRPEGWTLHWDLPSAGGFNGAANYSYPIEVPPGHNRMQPLVNLSYSSSAINGALKTLSGGTVAAGWSLNEISVVRTGVKQINQEASSKPQTYRLVLNGAGYELVQKPSAPLVAGGTQFVLKDNPGVRALRFGDDTQGTLFCRGNSL